MIKNIRNEDATIENGDSRNAEVKNKDATLRNKGFIIQKKKNMEIAMEKNRISTHTHTHTHVCMYIYVYIYIYTHITRRNEKSMVQPTCGMLQHMQLFIQAYGKVILLRYICDPSPLVFLLQHPE